jgi:two-component system, OmpR family, phosphate regulon response regulator OmpR
MTARILIIDDDERLAAMLRSYLEGRGYTVECRADAASGLGQVRQGRPDAVVLDVMLPDLDGFEVLKKIRAGSQVPVIMLTARGEDTDRIVGLELGADDYLPKPFNPRELVARLAAVLRRGAPAPAEPRQLLKFAELEIDRDERVVRVAGEARSLTGHQFELLWVLATSAGRVLSRTQLMERVRGEDFDPLDRSIDVHISRIRAAIEVDPQRPQRIVTVRGAGYVFATGERKV